MQKFATSMIGRPVLLKAERAMVGIVSDLIVDDATGKLLGLLVREGFGKKNVKTIAEKDIEGIGQNFFLVKSYSVLGEPDEIIRLKAVLDKKIKILGSKVYTVSNQFIGKTYDFTIDVGTGYLSKLYVKPSALLPFATDHIVDFSQIICIEKDRIVVEDTSIKAKSPLKIENPETP